MANPVKLIEKYTLVRDELYNVQRKIAHLQSELDGLTNELADFFEQNNFLKLVPVDKNPT